MAKDRPMELGKKTQVEHYYPARLKYVVIFGDKAVMALVAWEGYDEVTAKNALQIVHWDDIKWQHELGKGKRVRKQPDAYDPDDQKWKPKSKKKMGKKVQEIIDLLHEEDEEDDGDEKSQAERKSKLEQALKGMAAADVN